LSRVCPLLAPRMLVFTAPQLASAPAHLLALAFCALYVGSIYVSSTARLSFRAAHPSPASSLSTLANDGPRGRLTHERWRDDPDVIKARLLAVFLATLACCAIVYILLYRVVWPQHMSTPDVLARLGFISNASLAPWETLRPHLVMPVLYLGPLYAVYLSRALPGQKWWSWEMNVRRGLLTWQATRNVFAVRLLPHTTLIHPGLRAAHATGSRDGGNRLQRLHAFHSPSRRRVQEQPPVFVPAHLWLWCAPPPLYLCAAESLMAAYSPCAPCLGHF
jgi:hypothetical protein